MSEQKLIAAIRRNGREEIRVTLGEWNGAPVFGIRAWFKADDGTMRPSKDGLTLGAALLPDLARALADAERIARQAGLLSISAPGEAGGADG
jgi:Transcriptional Coactivator p15 (PC4)